MSIQTFFYRNDNEVKVAFIAFVSTKSGHHKKRVIMMQSQIWRDATKDFQNICVGLVTIKQLDRLTHSSLSHLVMD